MMTMMMMMKVFHRMYCVMTSFIYTINTINYKHFTNDGNGSYASIGTSDDDDATTGGGDTFDGDTCVCSHMFTNKGTK